MPKNTATGHPWYSDKWEPPWILGLLKRLHSPPVSLSTHSQLCLLGLFTWPYCGDRISLYIIWSLSTLHYSFHFTHKGSEKCEGWQMMASVYNNIDERCCVGVLMGRGSHLTPFPENKTTAHMAASQDWDSASFQTITGERSGRRGPWWEALCTRLTFSLTSLWRSFQFLETGFGAELHNISIYLLINV